MRKAMLVSALMMVFLMSPRLASAAMPVIDEAAIIEIVVNGAYLLELIGLSTQDLAQLSNFSTILGVVSELAVVYDDITALVNVTDARGVGWRSLAATVPCTPGALRGWNGQAAAWMQGGLGDVRNVTALFRRMTGLVQRLSSLLGGILGSTGGLQSVSANVLLLIGTVDKFATGTHTFQQATIGEQEQMVMNSLSTVTCLQPQRLENWGTVSTWPK